MPSLIKKAKSFLQSRHEWIKAGRPMRTPEKIKELYNNVCKVCPHYLSSGYSCDICGCYINEGTSWNKLAWATTRCPDEPPKWTEDYVPPVVTQEEAKVIDEQIKVEEAQSVGVPETPQVSENPPTAPPKRGCGCG